MQTFSKLLIVQWMSDRNSLCQDPLLEFFRVAMDQRASGGLLELVASESKRFAPPREAQALTVALLPSSLFLAIQIQLRAVKWAGVTHFHEREKAVILADDRMLVSKAELFFLAWNMLFTLWKLESDSWMSGNRMVIWTEILKWKKTVKNHQETKKS